METSLLRAAAPFGNYRLWVCPADNVYDLLVTVLMLGNNPGPGSTTTITRPVAYPAALESGEHPLPWRWKRRRLYTLGSGGRAHFKENVVMIITP